MPLMVTLLLQVKASLRKLPNAESSLQAAEAACFQAQQIHVQRLRDDQAADLDNSHVTEALKALQMLLLLLEFPKEYK